MRTGRPKAVLTISEEERAQLTALARSRSLPAALVQRAQIVLACACEPSNQAAAAPLADRGRADAQGRRFVAERVAGLHDELRPGRPERSRTTPSPR